MTPDELERAKKPILTALRESARTNPYWLGAVIGSCQEFPQRLDWARNARQLRRHRVDHEGGAWTPWPEQYLGADKAFQVIVRPEPEPAKP